LSVGTTAQTTSPVSLFSATIRLPAAVVKTLPSPTETPRCWVAGPKLLGGGAVADGTHFHFTTPVAASSATTPPPGGFTYITPSTTIGIVCCAVAVPPGPGYRLRDGLGGQVGQPRRAEALDVRLVDLRQGRVPLEGEVA
jgi:hypothetical protein